MAKKSLKIAYKPYILPSGFSEMDVFLESHKTDMTEQVLDSIEYALQKNLDTVEVFKFKGSDFVIALSYDTFKQNLENVYNYYISTEKYELCTRVKKIETKLNTVTYKLTSHEKK
jgi:hypothetical protein